MTDIENGKYVIESDAPTPKGHERENDCVEHHHCIDCRYGDLGYKEFPCSTCLDSTKKVCYYEAE